MTSFTRAIVRPPGTNFARGLTSASLGTPDIRLAQQQHERYCGALEACGLELVTLAPDERYPDSTFVEDTAVLSGRMAVLANPGAPSRTGEVDGIREPVSRFFASVADITPPGTLDGGDVCDTGLIVLIGISQRTNEEGARQLASLVQDNGAEARLIDIRHIPGILHLKSDIAYLGDVQCVATKKLAGNPALKDFDVLLVPDGEEYAANMVRVNDAVLTADGFPEIRKALEARHYNLVILEMSEFRKMDGGLSCLSLRF